MIQKKDIIEGLEEVWAAWENFGSELSEEEWLTSSRCPGWTVKDNLSHIAGTENMLAGNPAPEILFPNSKSIISYFFPSSQWGR